MPRDWKEGEQSYSQAKATFAGCSDKPMICLPAWEKRGRAQTLRIDQATAMTWGKFWGKVRGARLFAEKATRRKTSGALEVGRIL